MFEQASDSKSQPAPGAESASLDSLKLQIEAHQAHDQSQSCLGWAIGHLYRKDERSLESLQSLYQQGLDKQKAGDTAGLAEVQKQAAQVIKADRENVSWQDEITHYGGGLLKNASLFLGGKIGLAGTFLLFAADQVNPHDNFKTIAFDGLLGATKGALLKAGMQFGAERPISIVGKGMLLGLSSRVIDVGLTRQTYLDSRTGEYSAKTGLSRVVDGGFNLDALAFDAAAFGLAGGMLEGANSNLVTGGAIKRSPFLGTLFTGTSFGLSSGAAGEIMRQRSEGEQFDLGKIVKRSLLQGALDTVSAVPGGIHADATVRSRLSDSAGRLGGHVDRGIDALTAKINDLGSSVANMADTIKLLGAGMQPAYAGVPGLSLGSELPGRTVLRPEKGSNVAQMSGGHGGHGGHDGPTGFSGGLDIGGRRSGADLDGVLDFTPPKEPKVDGARIDQAQAVPPPAPERAAESAPRERTGEPERAGRPEQPVYTPAQVDQFHRFQDLAQKYVSAEGTQADKEALMQVLRANPDLQTPIMKYAAAIENYKLTAAVQEFYKPAIVKMDVPSDQRQNFEKLRQLADYLKATDQNTAARAKTAINGLLNSNPGLEPVARDYGSFVNDARVARVFDERFGTRHAEAIEQRLRAPAAAPERATTPAAAERSASPTPEATAKQPVATGTTNPGDAGTVNPGDKAAPGPASYADLARALNDANPAVQARAMRVLSDSLGNLSDAEFLDWKDVAVKQLNMGYLLDSPDLPEVSPALLKQFLSKSAVDPNAPPPDWAVDHIETSRKREEERAASERAQGREPRPPRPPREFPDTISNRLEMLGKVMDAVKQAPDLDPGMDIKLIELGAQDKNVLDSVLYAIGYQRGEDGRFTINPADKQAAAYRSLFNTLAPNASGPEPIKYLFRFLKERNEEGAYAAALQAEPQYDRTHEPEEIEREVEKRTVDQISEKAARGEQYNADDVEAAVRDEVEQEFIARRNAVDDLWQKTRDLIHDLAAGNIKPLKRSFAGKPGGGRRNFGGGSGGPRNPGQP